jgi:hypothetical protein
LNTPHLGSRYTRLLLVPSKFSLRYQPSRVGGVFGNFGKAIWATVVHAAVASNGQTGKVRVASLTSARYPYDLAQRRADMLLSGKELIMEDQPEPILLRMTLPSELSIT